jgi:adhesin/invasin
MVRGVCTAFAGFVFLQLGCSGGESPVTVDSTPALITAQTATSLTGVSGAVATPAPSVKVTTSGGTAVAGVAVTFAVTAGGGSVTGGSATTNASGIATVGSWTLGAAGTNTLTATVAALTPVTFTATASAPATKLAVTTAPSTTAANRTVFAVQPVVQLQDANGTPVSMAGIAVTASITTGGGTLGGTAVATTSAAGAATFSGLSIAGTVGARTITFSASGLASATATVTTTAGAATAMGVSAGNNQSAAIGTNVTTPPAVIVTDADANPVSGTSVTFAVASGGGSITGGSVSSNASGIASVGSWMLGPNVGANTLTATSSGLTGSPVTFTATAIGVAHLTLTTSPTAAPRNRTAFGTQPVVQLRDGNNANVASAGVVISAAITAGGGTLGGTVTATTSAGGTATFTNLSIAGVVGARTITFSAPGYAAATASVTLTAGDATTVAINAGNNQTAAAGTAVATPPSVLITDADANPVSGEFAGFAVASGGGSVTGGNVFSNASGIAAVGSWTLGGNAGANTLTATSTGLIGSPLTFTATGTTGPHLTVTTAPSASATVAAAFATQPVLQLRDASGVAVATAGVVVTATIASGGGTLGGTTTATTSATGAAAFTNLQITGTAGSRTLAFSAPSYASATASVSVSAGAAATIAVSAGNGQTAAAGATLAVAPAVLVTDAGGNPVSGVAVAFAVASGGGSLTGASATSNASGIATVGSWTLGAAGANTVTATASGLAGSPITFTATATVPAVPHLALTTAPSTSAPSGVVFGTQPVVQLRDANDAVVASAGVVVTASISAGGGTLGGTATATTLSNGSATFTNLSIAGLVGSRTLSFDAPGYSAVTASVLVTAGEAASIAVNAGNNQSAVAGAALATQPSVIVKDASTNPVSGVAVTFAVATGGGSLTGGSATTNASGVATVGSWTLGTTAGANTMTATSSGLSGSPVTLTATGTSGAPASLSKQAGDNQTAPASTAVSTAPSVKLADANGNGISGATVTFTVTGGGGSVTGGTQTTNASGIATVTGWTLGASTGANALTASSSGVSSVVFNATASVAATKMYFCYAPYAPIWLAYQNGTGGAWTQVANNGDNTFNVPIETVGAVSWVADIGTGFYYNYTYYVTKAEIPNTIACGVTGPAPTRTLNGNVSGATASDSTIVSFAYQTKAVAGSGGSFSMSSLSDGPWDLFAVLGPRTGQFVPTKYIVRRNQNPASGATLDALDFAAAEAKTPDANSTMTVTGLGTDTYGIGASVATALGFSGLSSASGTGAGGNVQLAYHPLPSTLQSAGDFYSANLTAFSADFTSVRALSQRLTSFGNRTITMGPSLSTPTVTQVSTSPRRFRAQIASQTEYNDYFYLSLAGGSRGALVHVTAAYLGGTPGTWDITMPDLTSAGFQASWGMTSGLTSWTAFASGAMTDYSNPAIEGIWGYAYRTSSLTATMQSPILSPLFDPMQVTLPRNRPPVRRP